MYFYISNILFTVIRNCTGSSLRAAVDDIDARIDLAKKGGATLAQEPFDVPGIGRIAMVREPGGALIGWMTPSPPPQE